MGQVRGRDLYRSSFSYCLWPVVTLQRLDYTKLLCCQPVVSHCFGVGRETISSIACQFGVVGDLRRVCAAFDEMMCDHGGYRVLAPLVHLLEYPGNALMQHQSP